MPSEFFLTTERDPPLKRYCSARYVEGPLSTPGKNLTALLALLAQFAKGKYVSHGVSETVAETGESCPRPPKAGSPDLVASSAQ